jgi:hypothetical protein
MAKRRTKGGWLTISLIFLTPVLFIFFLGSQMAYSQVSRQFERYGSVSEAGSLAALEALPAGQMVMLRGQISEAIERPNLAGPSSDLLIFQVRPAGGREVRFQEVFPLIFPKFVMALPDGTLTIQPSSTRDRVIYDELHHIADGEYELTGFQPGDTVIVQGQWQPEAGAGPALVDVTGITGGDRTSFIAGWQQNMWQVRLARNLLGVLSLAGLVVLVAQLRRSRRNQLQEEVEAWPSQKRTTAPTT